MWVVQLLDPSEELQTRNIYDGQQSGFLVDPINPTWFQNSLDLDRILDGTFDIESDIYFYSFGNYSGSFSFNTNLEVVQRDQTDLKIEPVFTNYSFNKLLWKITTPDGTKYYFGDDTTTDGIADDAVSFANHYVQPKNMVGAPGRTNPLVDSWYLVKIESYDGTSVIDFEYDEYEAYSYRNLGTSALVHVTDDGMNIVNTNNGSFNSLNPVIATEALTPRITAVVTDDRRIEFEYESTFRMDLDSHETPGLHPRYVVGIPSSKVVDATACDKVVIKSANGTYLNEYDFHQDYFCSNADGFTETLGLTTQSDGCGTYYSDMRRLRLDSITRRSASRDHFGYGFDYYDDMIQRRLTYAVDHHGYPNGVTSNTTLLPSIKIGATASSPPIIDLTHLSVLADRSPDASIVKKMMLNTIRYPSGGMRTIDYEGHDYYGSSIVESTADRVEIRNENCSIPQGCPTCCYGQDSTSNVFTITNSPAVDYKLIVRGTRTMQDQSNNAIDLIVNMDWGLGMLLFDNIVLNAGNNYDVTNCYTLPYVGVDDYQFELSANPSRRLFMQLLLRETVKTDIMTNMTVGGLRVKSVVDDPGDGLPIERSYTYNSDTSSTASSGELISLPTYFAEYPSNAAITLNPDPNNPTCIDVKYRFTSGNTYPLASVQGSHIGYSRVVETIGSQDGYTEYIYSVDGTHEASHIRLYPAQQEYFIDPIAGRMLDRKVYNNNDELVTSQSTSYGKVDNGGANPYQYLGRYSSCNAIEYLQVTYTTPNSFVHPTSSINFKDGVTTTQTFEFGDLPDYTQMTAEEVVNSDGKVHRTEYTYGYEYFSNAAIQADLISQNRILPAWQTIKKVDGVVVDGQRTRYAYMNSSTGDMLSPSSTAGGIIHPAVNERNEVTWIPVLGTIDNQGWKKSMEYKQYDIDEGLPTSIHQDGWSHDHIIAYSNSGKPTNHTFNAFTTTYDYDSNHDLLESINKYDGTSTSYLYDELLRLKTATDDCRVVVNTTDYHYADASPVTGVGGSNDRSFIKTTMDYPPVTGSDLTSVSDYSYYDGIDRLQQQVRQQQAPNQLDDIVLHTVYDDQGRAISETQPFASTSNGVFSSGFSSIPSTTMAYHDDPTSRVETMTPPSWYETEQVYTSNTAADAVNGYSPGELYRAITIDPDGDQTIVFTDKLGLVVLSRQTDAADSPSSRLDTYTIYDDKLRISKVIPPGASVTDNDLIYKKCYSGDDQLIWKDDPDCTISRYTYDDRELLSGVQNPVLQSQGRWLVTQYDDYGRPSARGYSSNVSPANNPSIDDVLEEYFYDGFDGTSTVSGNQYLGRPRKQRLKVLEDAVTNTDWIESVYSYDDCGRTTMVESSHHLDPSATAEVAQMRYDNADNVISVDRTTIIAGVNYMVYDSMTYDHVGRSLEHYRQINNESIEQLCRKAYDEKDLLTQLELGGNGSSLTQLRYTYNDQQWLTAINDRIIVGGADKPCLGISGSNVDTPTDDLFFLKLNYDTAFTALNTDVYRDGNITSMEWQVPKMQVKGYGFSYDSYNRLTAAKYGQRDVFSFTDSDFYSTSYRYDKRGNIRSLDRKQRSLERSVDGCYEAITIDSMDYVCDGDNNQISQVMDNSECPPEVTLPDNINDNLVFNAKRIIAVNTTIDCRSTVDLYAGTELVVKDSLYIRANCGQGGTTAYGNCSDVGNQDGFSQRDMVANYNYDNGGNMTTDPNKGITVSYNHLNLAYKVEITQGVPKELLITYDALGRKLYQEILIDGTSTERRDYINEIQLYNNNVESILHDHGRSVPVPSGDYQYQYHIKDHLGNVRVAFADLDGDGTITPYAGADPSELLSERHYYPFGMQMAPESVEYVPATSSTANRYSYNNKELIDDLDLQWLAYGARFYDPAIGRFTGVDPLADQFPGWNPYNYTLNNPINMIDPDGRAPDWIKQENDDGSATYIAEQGDSAESLEEQHGIPFEVGNAIIQGVFGENLPNGTPEGRSNIHPGDQITIFAVQNTASESNDSGGGFWAWLGSFFSEGEQQQHSGENWTIYANGSRSGWSINAPKADPNGANKSIDISGMFPAGGGLPPYVNPIKGLAGFNDRVNRLVDKINPSEAVDSICNSCYRKPHGLPYRRIDSNGNVIDTIKNR